MDYSIWQNLYGQTLGEMQAQPVSPAGPMTDWFSAQAGAPASRQSTPAPVRPDMGWLEGFGKSAWASFPELVGISAPEEVQQWRAGNPVSNIASQILPMIVPYTAAAKVGGAVMRGVLPRIMGGLDDAIMAGTRPITNAWKREALALTPFEAGRIATAAAVGDPGSVSDVAISAALDQALIPVIPAAWRGVQLIRGMRDAEPKLADLYTKIPGLSKEAPRQENLKSLYLMRSSANEDVLPAIEDGIAYLERSVRSLHSKKPLGELVGEGVDAGALRKFFRSGDKKSAEGEVTSSSRLLYQAVSDGYESPKAWQDEIAPLALPPDWLSYSELPRVYEAKTPAKLAGATEDIKKNLLPTLNGWFIREEADTGLYVMAKQLPNEKWFLTKSAQPNKLIGEDAIQINTDRIVKFSTAIKAAEEREVMQALGDDLAGSVVAQGRAFDNIMPRLKLDESPTTFTKTAALAERFLPGFESAAAVAADDVRQAWTLAKRFVSPGMFQFKKAPIAEDVRLRTQARFDFAKAQSDAINFGLEKAEDWQRPLAKIFNSKHAPPEGSVFGMVNKLKEEDMPLVSRLLNEEASLEDIGKQLKLLTEDLDQQTRISNFFDKAAQLDKKLNEIVTGTEKLYKVPETTWLANHYGVNHTWTGSLRRRIEDERKRLIAVASGRNPVELDKNTELLIGRYGGKKADTFYSGEELDEKLARELYQNRARTGDGKLRMGSQPATMANEREGIKGYIGDALPLTKNELFEIMKKNVDGKYRYQAELSTKHDLMPDVLEAYSRYGKETGDQLVLRMNQIAGRKGSFDRLQNRAVSKVLAPILGTNAADKLSAAYNKTEYTLQLLAGNMAHAALQATTFVQTVLPKAAMVLGAPPGRLGEIMGVMPHYSASGKVAGVRNFLDPLLITGRAFKSLVNPTSEEAQLLARAAQDGVIAPRFMEEFIGQKSLRGQEIADAANSKIGGAIKLLDRVSQYIPVKMEEMSRAHSFLVGTQLARRIFPDAPEDYIYQFGKQFTFRTMYQYAAADRPRMFAGPLGGVYGLFKNWMFHNIADWSSYGGEAAKRGNFAPLMWALAGQGAIGGLGSIPAIGLANSFYRMATDGDGNLMNALYDNVPHSDALYFGLPSLLGVSLQANASAPFADPTRDINFMFNAAILDRGAKVGKLIDYIQAQTGLNQNPFEIDRTWDLASYALAPRLMYRGLAQVEDGALKAIRNGQPIISGISFPEQVLNAIGFTPTKIAKAYELSEDVWRNRNEARRQTQNLGEAFAQGMIRGDEDVMNFVVSRAVELGLDLSHIMRSARDRVANQTTPILPYEFRKDPKVWQGLERLGLG